MDQRQPQQLQHSGYSPPSPEHPQPSPEWITILLRKAGVLAPDAEVKTVKKKGDALQGGITNGIFVCELEYNTPKADLPSTIVYKASRGGVNMRQGREAEFCDPESGMRKGLACLCTQGGFTPFPSPRIYGSIKKWGGPQGVYIVMENLQGKGIRADQFHGAQAGTQTLQKKADDVFVSLKSEEMWQLAFEYAAETHARYWGCFGMLRDMKRFDVSALKSDKKLLEGIEQLKYADWLAGKNRKGYEASIENCVRIWDLVEKGWMSTRLKTFISKCLQTADFDKMVEEMQKRPITLVHGDFHAKNLFYLRKYEVCSVDFSEIGVGDPISDLTQYILSDIPTSVRRKHEKKVLTAYWSKLKSRTPLAETKNVDNIGSMTFDDFLELYRTGIDRWIWFFPFMAYFDGCTKLSKISSESKKSEPWSPPTRTVYFHDAILGFLEDHCDGIESLAMRGVCEINAAAFLGPVETS